MNERILELYIKTLNEECSNPALVDIEKFAELIVKECMGLAMTEKSRYANLNNKEADQNKYLTMLHCATSMDNYRLLLKEHFGVEE
jgi:hypothetical protein